jgi:hypothetical protein
LLRRSPLALCPYRLGSRVFTHQAPEKQIMYSRDPLLGFGSPSEVTQAPSRRLETPVSQSLRLLVLTKGLAATPPLRFCSLQRLLARSSGCSWSSLPHSTASASRFSQLPGAFIRPELTGLVSCRIRSWEHPSELSSARAAVRCFQRHSLLDVRTTHNERPRLQGLSPRESPPSHSAC